jgi:hypothetical protein
MLTIVLSGLSAGMGLMATEVLKAAGKDLWTAVKQLILKVRHQPSEAGGGDVLKIVLRVDDIELSVSIEGLKQKDEAIVEALLLNHLDRLYDRAVAAARSTGMRGGEYLCTVPGGQEFDLEWIRRSVPS